MQLPVMVQVMVTQVEEPGVLPLAPMLPAPPTEAPSLAPTRAAAPPLQLDRSLDELQRQGAINAKERQQFDRSLDELQRQGAINAKERQQLEQPLRPGVAGMGAPPLRELCRTGVMSQRDCLRGQGLFGLGKTPATKPRQAQLTELHTDEPGEQIKAQVFAITPERRALLNTIRYAEGTWKGGRDTGYQLFGNGTFMKSLDSHPGAAAAGAYQLTLGKWESAMKAIGLTSFDPHAQDQAALYLIQYLNALKLVDKGALTAELAKRLSGEWTSFPDSTDSNKSGQPAQRLSELQRFYEANLARLRGVIVCPQADIHQQEADSFPNPSIQRTIALQRRNSARSDCNRYQVIQAKSKRTDWKTYGEIQIPWGLWREPIKGKRMNGFLGGQNSIDVWGPDIENRLDPTLAPNGIAVSCTTGTFSINTNLQWQSRPQGWAAWQAPPKGSDWERIVIDLCSPVINKS